jgi:cholesterol oxidase
VLGAEYSGLPAWLGKRFITVHPLGGAAMGRHPGEGVSDAYGEVFDHPGLYIADGAVMPGPVGANPSLTIAAMADRMSTRMLETKPVRTRSSVQPKEAGEPTSLTFDEEMAGFVALGATDPLSADKSRGERLSFQLSIRIDDVDAFLSHPDHLARAEGWVEARCCGGRRPVERGWFNLFAPSDSPDSRVMRYQLWFTDGEGRPRTLSGWKDVHDGPVTKLWHDTSTLYTRLMRGHVPPDGDTEEVDGAGTLHINPLRLAATLTSFRADGPQPVAALARFGRFFVGQLWDVYGPG